MSREIEELEKRRLASNARTQKLMKMQLKPEHRGLLVWHLQEAREIALAIRKAKLPKRTQT
jgi:hypothetical protein